MRATAATVAECFLIAAFVVASALVTLAAAITPFELN
jgi:hypothetical protein